MIEKPTVYFDKGSPEHTDATIEALKKRIDDFQPATVIVASTSGKTGLAAARALESTKIRVIVVPFQAGSAPAEKWGTAQADIRHECERLGAQFLPDTPLCRLLDNDRPDIVDAWRVLGQGLKVALQVASMCVDTGLVESGAEVIALGGTGRGADTAVVLTTHGYEDVLKSKVKEIIAIPSL